MKKQLKELTLKDNFMFGAVMMEEENCMELLLSGSEYKNLSEAYVIFICNTINHSFYYSGGA